MQAGLDLDKEARACVEREGVAPLILVYFGGDWDVHWGTGF